MIVNKTGNWESETTVSTSTVLKKREYTQIRRISPQTKITSSQTKAITPKKKVIVLYRAQMTNMRLQSFGMKQYMLHWVTSVAVEMFCLVTLAFDLLDLFNSLSLAKSYIYHFAIFALIDLMGSFGVARFNKKSILRDHLC